MYKTFEDLPEYFKFHTAIGKKYKEDVEHWSICLHLVSNPELAILYYNDKAKWGGWLIEELARVFLEDVNASIEIRVCLKI